MLAEANVSPGAAVLVIIGIWVLIWGSIRVSRWEKAADEVDRMRRDDDQSRVQDEMRQLASDEEAMGPPPA